MTKITLLDDGKPSKDPLKDLKRSLEFAKDDRFDAAYNLYCDAKKRIEEWETSWSTQNGTKKEIMSGNPPPNATMKRFEKGRLFLKQNSHEFEALSLIVTDSSEYSASSLGSGISRSSSENWMKKLLKEFELRKEKKKKYVINVSRIKAQQQLVPQKRSNLDNRRLKGLMDLSKHHTSSLSLYGSSEDETTANEYILSRGERVIPLLSLLLMMFIFYGDFLPSEQWALSYSSTFISWSYVFYSFIKVMALLIFYGIVHISVLWFSLSIVFDSVERSMTNLHILISAKKLFYQKLIPALILFTNFIISCSLIRAFIIVVARHLRLSKEGHTLSLSDTESTSYKNTVSQNDCINFTCEDIQYSERCWEILFIDMAKLFMAYTATYCVILSLAFSLALTPHKENNVDDETHNKMHRPTSHNIDASPITHRNTLSFSQPGLNNRLREPPLQRSLSSPAHIQSFSKR